MDVDTTRGSRRQTSVSRSIGRSLSRAANRTLEEVFAAGSTSRGASRAEEDEEALIWAALEKLPTYDRLRRTVLKSLEETPNPGNTMVVHREVDVRKLGLNERLEFIDRFFKVAEEDNEKFLVKLRNRIDK